MNLFETKLNDGKTVPVTQQQVLAAWRKVRAAGGSGGVDGKSLIKVEENLKDELYKLWNRLASGSYFPSAVKAVAIPKDGGGQRWLGVPAVLDRVAQQVVKDALEPELEKVFHQDSYGYRPNKSAHDAVDKCRIRCLNQTWVIDMDIKGFFDNLDHDLLFKALEKHVKGKWMLCYIERWLKAPVEQADGSIESRQMGTPQGGVISPLLANLFLHYAFDKWMEKELPYIRFERYADDIIIHCITGKEAEEVKEKVEERLKACKLELHPQKTRIVYCKQKGKNIKYPVVSFDFLGFEFKPRKVKLKDGTYQLGYGPAIGRKAKTRIATYFRQRKIHRASGAELQELAIQLAPKTRGWINYFGKFRKWSMYPLFQLLHARLVKWLMAKYKRYRGRIPKAWARLKSIARDYPNLFVHWQYGFLPS